LAPEVIEGSPSSPASDVHCWGATMAFAATGHLPFGGGSYESIFYRIVSGHAALEGAPAPLVPLISAALARDPAHRPSASWLSAQAEALEVTPAAAAGRPSPTAGPTSVYTGSPFPASLQDTADLAAVPPVPLTPSQASQEPQKQQKQQNPQKPTPASPPWPQDQLEKYRNQKELWRQDQENAGQIRPAAAPNPKPKPRPQTRPNTMAGLAIMIAAVALTV